MLFIREKTLFFLTIINIIFIQYPRVILGITHEYYSTVQCSDRDIAIFETVKMSSFSVTRLIIKPFTTRDNCKKFYPFIKYCIVNVNQIYNFNST